MLRSKGTDVAKSNGDKIALLRGHHLFCDLDASAFDRFGRSAKRKLFKRGASIFAKGDPGNSLFFVVSGTVKIGVSSADGRGAIFNLINPGEIFGEIAVLDGLARTADAIANANCELFVMDRRDFMILLDSQPALAKKLIELLCVRLRWISDHVEQVIFPDLPGKLAKALLRLIDKTAANPGFEIAVTQQEIGEMVGMSRESVNKQLHEWAALKLVRVQRGAITIVDMETLKALAERSGD